MKNYILSVLLMFCALAFAQREYGAADKSFESLWYKKAAKQYENIIAKGDMSQEILQKIGDAYFFNTDMKNASKWYGELFANYEKTIAPEYVFRYVHSLKGIENYTLAKAVMKIHAEARSNDAFDVAQLKENDQSLDEILNGQPQFNVTNLSINTSVADFGTAFFEDKIIFASNRDSLRMRTRTYGWNEQPWLNLYVADTTLDGTDLKNIRLLSKNINTKYHEAVAAFSAGENRIYFTRNNYTDKIAGADQAGFNHLKLYFADRVDGEFTNIQEVPFNSNDYSVGQPALSADGKNLYFVSDMPGSIGGTDIFVVDILEDGTFSEPKNLGTTVNTAGREMFPFLTKDKIYFSSDGHLGLGGLDVFELKLDDLGKEPVNLGRPLNSNKDDFAYIVDETTRRGYVSSNREGGVGDDDIYSFERAERQCVQTVVGTVSRKANELPVAGVQVFITTTAGELLEVTTTDVNGAFSYEKVLDCKTDYEITIEKMGYISNKSSFSTSDEPDRVHSLSLVIEKELNKLIVNENGELKIDIDDIYFDVNKAEIRPDAAQELYKIIEVMKEYPKMIIKIESHTDARGGDAYNEQLSDKRAKSTGQYIISQGIESYRIESAIGYGESQLLNRCGDGVKCSKEEHDVNRRSEFIIVKMDETKSK